MFPNNRDSDFLLEHWLVTERSNKFQTHLAFLYPDSREGEKVDDFLALELNRRKEFLEKIVIEKTAALAQRNYDQAVLKYAKEELRLISQLAKKRAAHNIEGIYEEYGLARRALVNPIWVPDDEFVAKWQQRKYKKRVFKEGEPEFFTKRGERVMSKTEILIANILADLGVPYLYEYPLYLTARGWIKTDFATLNVRTRRIRFWEHFGKMGDPDYCADRLEKILDYERDGYFPGTHLIITHETQDRPADTRLLEAVARHYLL